METKPTIFLTADSVQSCSKCNKYLSVGPVTISSGKPLCGRCPNPEATPASFYDRLAQYMYFPCTNDRYGCNSMLAWGSVEAHEKICKYTLVVCPALNCHQKFKKKAVFDHFKTEHGEHVAYNREFKVPCGNEDENNSVNKFFIWDYQAFILKINFSSSTCFCSVSSWGSSDAAIWKYNLLIEDEGKRQSFLIKDVDIVEYETKDHNNSTMTKLDVDFLKRALKAKTMVCTVNIEQLSRNSDNDRPPSIFECSICNYYTEDSIYMCTVGHCICNSCKNEVMPKCPYCPRFLEECGIFSNEKIIVSSIKYRCRNSTAGCCFTGSWSNLIIHETMCSHGAKTTECYMTHITECTWSGPLSEMMSHLRQKHPDSHVDMNNLVVINVEKFISWVYFTEYNGQIFKVIVSRNSELGLQVGVQLVKHPSMQYSKYQFYIDFIDPNENNRILKVNGNCIFSHFDADDLTLDNSFVIDDQLIKQFAKKKLIKFRINLVER